MRRVFRLDWYEIWSAVDAFTSGLESEKSILTEDLDGLFLHDDVKKQIEMWVEHDVNSPVEE